MDIAIEMLIPIVGALFLGMWLQNEYGMSPLWTVLLAILGMVAGIWIVYKRHVLNRRQYLKNHPPIPRQPEKPFNHRPWEEDEEEDDNDSKLI